MTLEQKIGQLMMIGWQNDNVDDLIELIENYNFGNIILFTRNIQSASQLREMTKKIQEAAIKYNGVPAFIAIDQEGGNVRRIYEGVTNVPGHMAIGAASNYDKDAAYKVGKILGEELKCAGVNFNLAPVADINNNANNPVIGIRSFSDDPYKVSDLARDFSKGHEEFKVMTSYKHFMGHGNIVVDSHLDLPHLDISYEEMKKMELIPYLNKNYQPPAIMTAHILYSKIDDRFPATISRKIIHDILRTELNYKGIVITDCFEMEAITRAFSLGEAAVFSIKATVDIVTISHTFGRQLTVRNALLEAARNNIITKDELDARVDNILKHKERYARSIVCEVNYKKNQEIADKISLDSVALVSGKPFEIDKDTVVIGVTNYLNSIAEDANVENIDIAKEIATEFNLQHRSIDSKNFNVNEVGNFAKDKKIILALSDSHITLVQKVLYTQLIQKHKKVMLISLRTPYDVLYQELPTCHYAIFEYTKQSVKSLIKVLKGHTPTGKSPVIINKREHSKEYLNIENQIVRKAILYIEENYAKQLKLSDVADEFNVSREHLSRLIKEHTGTNYKDYLANARINRAKKFLSSTTLRVYEIGLLVGFIEPGYFTKKFKEIVGISPKDFRNQSK